MFYYVFLYLLTSQVKKVNLLYSETEKIVNNKNMFEVLWCSMERANQSQES